MSVIQSRFEVVSLGVLGVLAAFMLTVACAGCDTGSDESEETVNPVAEFVGLWSDMGFARAIEITDDGQACLNRLDWYWTDCFGCLDSCSIQVGYEPDCASAFCGDLELPEPDGLSGEFGDVVFTIDMGSSGTGFDLIEGRFLPAGPDRDEPKVTVFWSITSSPCSDLELDGHYSGLAWYPDEASCPPPED